MLRHILIILALLISVTPALAAPLRLMVDAARIVTDPLSGFDQLQIDLSPASQQDLATFTAAHVGKVVDVTIDGKIITSPVIQTVITGPSLMLSGNFSGAELQSLAASLTAQSAIVEVKPAKHKR